MRPHPNNDIRNIPSEKGKGVAGALLIHLGLLVLLLIVAFSPPKPPEEETGILVNFGTDETGTGLIEPSPPPPVEAAAAAQQPVAEAPSKEKPVVTQDFDDEAPVVKKVDPEAERKKKEQIEAENRRIAELEAERIKKEKEEAERKRIAEEQQRTSEIMNRTKNALANSRNAGTKTTSEGVAGGQGNQGDPSGSVDSQVRGDGSGTGDKGVSYALAGRRFRELPLPRYDYQKEGRVVVEVFVDRYGKVTQANAGVKGSETLDEDLLNAAKEAALKARFDEKQDAPVQRGTITYIFKLK